MLTCKIAHLHGTTTDDEFNEALPRIATNIIANEPDADIVVFIDEPRPGLPDGAIVVLENGAAVHVCVVSDWPEAPLARPYAHLASAMSAGRDALLAGETPEEAAQEALERLRYFTGEEVRDAELLKRNFANDFTLWSLYLGEPDAA